ncbi:MAG: ferric reductase-like transmembrane domain-containing protein [Gammaproteobacteria bacterium]|nr:ferric reductase-like transmembrane domain-containing protein [Gammaproteobacteria bacterium]
MINWARVLVWLLGAAPVGVALLYVANEDTESTGAVLNALGRLTGVGGLAVLLVAAMISCRVPGFDRPFGGLTKLWQTHHKLGAAAFLLVLAHPVLLALGAADVSARAAARVLVPESFEWSTAWGWGGLLVMTAFLAPSFAFFGEPEFQRWRNVHRLAAVAVVSALAHMWLAARSIPEPMNTVLWVLFAGTAVAALGYRFLFSRIGRLRYVVAGVERPAANVVELSLEPRESPLHYDPGQFVYLTPYDTELAAGRREEHPYTLSSSPTEERLRVAIKDLGDASEALQHVRVGSEIRVEGPYGCFFASGEASERELWIAGGIGIAPFLGRARYLAAARGAAEAVDVHLVYCVQDEARALYRDELERLADIPGFRMTMHFFHAEGPLRQEFLAQHCPDYTERTAYLCGPLPLIELATRELVTAGVPRRRIRSEELTLL